MTDKEIYDLIKTHGYEPVGDITFSESGKIYPNTYLRFNCKNLPEDVYTFLNMPDMDIRIKRNFTTDTKITFNAAYIHVDSLTDEDDNSDYILTKAFEDVSVSTIDRDKFLKILNQNNKVFKEIKVRIKKYKINEGFN